MHSKIRVKLPQIKTDSPRHNDTRSFIEKIHVNSTSQKEHTEKSKREIARSLNKLRFIALTPDFSKEKKCIVKEFMSPKLNEKINLSYLGWNNKKSRLKKSILRILKEDDGSNEINHIALPLPSRYHLIDIKEFWYNFPRQSIVNKSAEIKCKNLPGNFYSNKSMIQYYKF